MSLARSTIRRALALLVGALPCMSALAWQPVAFAAPVPQAGGGLQRIAAAAPPSDAGERGTAAPAAPSPADPDPPPPAFRLPRGVRPLRYDLALTLVPGEPAAAGTIAIDVVLDAPSRVVWLNADDVKVTSAGADDSRTNARVVASHPQFVGLVFDAPLAAGEHRLTLAFEAEQSRASVRGIFALQDAGAWYAMTQFEAVSARRAFPCFDEPEFKTPWSISLRVPVDTVALSNTTPVDEAPAEPGRKLVRFAPTRPLPTYLVAFAVGPWESVELGRVGAHGTPMRVVVPRGHAADTAFAAGAYPELFARLEQWFGIAYPFGKLDHVAIPLTVGFAMENAGMITYGRPTLLAAAGAATPRYRRIAANVGAHEMAHQWFGNLVTTAWWDDIWLNEAFATWMAAKVVDQWRPDYERGAAGAEARAEAIDADVLASARRIRQPVDSRGDIATAFDSITYQKGATVIGMFEGWIGERDFQRGVQSYLESRRDGSATAADFLASLDRASERRVEPAFRTFLDQNGVPRVDVALHCAAGSASLSLAQERLSLLGATRVEGQRWEVPVCVRYGRDGALRQACTLLREAHATLALEGGCPALVMANAGARGYYVPDYSPGLSRALFASRARLTPAEHASVLYDLKSRMGAGRMGADELLRWVRAGAAAGDRPVVLAAIELARFAQRTLFGEDERERAERFVRDAFGARARALGFASRTGEDDDAQLLRRELLRLVAPAEPVLSAQARTLARDWLQDRRAIEPGLVDVVLMTAAQRGDAALFDALLDAAKTTREPLDRRYLMMALFSFRDPALAERGLALLLDPAFDTRESWTALRSAVGWEPDRRDVSRFIAAHFDALARTVARDAPAGWPEYGAGLCTLQDRAELEGFWRGRAAQYPGGERELDQAAEAITVCAAIRAHARSARGASQRAGTRGVPPRAGSGDAQRAGTAGAAAVRTASGPRGTRL